MYTQRPVESSYIIKKENKNIRPFGSTPLKTFYLTFGQKSPARNGWIEVYARNIDDARMLVFMAYGHDWSMLYDEKSWEGNPFWAGKLGELK